MNQSFTVNYTKNPIFAKSKYIEINNKEKLQCFAELACYGSNNELGFTFGDASDKINRREASDWFAKELSFLNKRDSRELKEIWNKAIEDGSWTKMLFDAVKILQEKYG
jgi:hypothetical protein